MRSIVSIVVGTVLLILGFAGLGRHSLHFGLRDDAIDYARCSSKDFLDRSAKLLMNCIAAEQNVNGQRTFSDPDAFRQFMLREAQLVYSKFDEFECRGEIGFAVDRRNWISPKGGSMGGWIQFCDYGIQRYVSIGEDGALKELAGPDFAAVTTGCERFSHRYQAARP